MAADGICGLGGLLSCSEGRSASRQPHRCNHRCCSGGGGDCHTRRVRGGYDLPLASCGDCQLAVGVGVLGRAIGQAPANQPTANRPRGRPWSKRIVHRD
jgi:hypothetical protein